MEYQLLVVFAQRKMGLIRGKWCSLLKKLMGFY